MTNRPNTAAHYCWVVVDSDLNKFHCTLALLVQSKYWTLSHAHQDNHVHVWCGDYSRGRVCFVQLEPDNWCGTNSRKYGMSIFLVKNDSFNILCGFPSNPWRWISHLVTIPSNVQPPVCPEVVLLPILTILSLTNNTCRARGKATKVWGWCSCVKRPGSTLHMHNPIQMIKEEGT